jgi:hypothetical protein
MRAMREVPVVPICRSVCISKFRNYRGSPKGVQSSALNFAILARHTPGKAIARAAAVRTISE